ncbi:hypothetical protein LIER_35552 [Lithospermum erythrorhizon]|uniref:C2H2-type domain-containing protein n=1 Tax=Lithospermum erythrorhizon TaxID=34254 RepID=A0AAV3NSH6_LITER
MDTQEHQIKKSLSGRENQGVYLCTKCGWPFPKAHPSAKHRRAHKKLCGTIEGYKLVESDDHLAASDGEHAPCEDQRTPSSLLKELGSSDGNNLQSNRSADDLFSDAVAEFSDSGVSPPIGDHIKDLNKDMEKLAHSDSVEGQSFCGEATAGSLCLVVGQNLVEDKERVIVTTCISYGEYQVVIYCWGLTVISPLYYNILMAMISKVEFDANTSTFSSCNLISSIWWDSRLHVIASLFTFVCVLMIFVAIEGTLDKPIAPTQSIKKFDAEVEEQVINQSENANSSNEALIEGSPVASIGVSASQFDGSPAIFETPTDELINDIDVDAKDEEINKTLTGCLNPHVAAARESSEPHSSIEGTLDSSIDPIQSIKKSNSEVDEQVISKSENANSSSEARIEESPIASILVTALPFDTSPVIIGTPTDELIEGIDADAKDEEINRTFLNPHVEATRESSDLYLNKIDEQASDNIWEEESTSVAVIERLTKFDATENKTLDFVTQDTLVVNDASSLEKHLYTDNAVTEFDGNKNGDQSEVHRIFEHSGVGKDMDVSLFRKKEEETTVSKLEEQNEADIAVYTLSMPDSLANVALIEDFQDYASPKSSLSSDLGSSEVTTYVGDDKQAAIAAQGVSGFRFCSTTNQNTLKDNLNEKEAEHHITDKSCVSGSTEETINLVGGDNPDHCKMSKTEESDKGIKQYNENPLEDQLAANDKRTLGADGSFLSEDNQITNSLKVHHSQVLKEAVVELPEVCETIEKCGGAVEKNPEVAHESAGPTQKCSDVDVQQFDTRGNMDQIESSSCMAAYTLSQPGTGNVTDNTSLSQLGTGNVTDRTSLSQLGTGNVTDNTLSVASAVKNIERNLNVSSLSASDNLGAFITNGVASLPVGSEHQTSNMVDVTHSSQASKESLGCGSESLQGKGDDKLETQGDGVSVSIASSSRADSMDANWGSVSVVSPQSEAAASADAGVPSEKSQTTSLPVHKDAAESQTAQSDDFEPPSFMTLVEPGNAVPQKATPSDLSALSTQQQKDEDPKAGWFPSISNVVNDSQGRKKNEEIIDKVSSWSTGKKHSPLKNLLGEARSPNSNRRSSVTEKDEISLKNSAAAVTTVDAILRSEPNGKEIEKEWNSPARYPVEIKKERRKRKPYCIPFVCCLSVQQDL